MGKKIILNKDELCQKYIVEKLSQKDTAKYFNCSVDTIARNLNEYGIPKHTLGEWHQSNKIQLNQKQIEIINGAMLGDGCLYVHKNGINPQFIYTSKSKQHVEYVCNSFLDYSYKEGIKECVHFDKRTQKEYSRYTFRTISDIGLKNIYNEWYVNRKKHIPNSLKLTPLTCLIWYIGDGGICNGKKSQHIKLATNCFKKEEQENILIPQLSDFNAKLMKADKSIINEQQYFIYIPHKKMEDFLNYIGNCPFDDYLYKWNSKKTKYNSYVDFYPEWENMYLSGVGYTKIAKQFGADNTTVLYFLQKRGIYKRHTSDKQYYNK